MFYNTQDMLWRRKLEEQAIELQSRRLMSLQLLDVKRHSHHRTLSTGASIPSPTHSPNFLKPIMFSPSDNNNSEVIEEWFKSGNGCSCNRSELAAKCKSHVLNGS